MSIESSQIGSGGEIYRRLLGYAMAYWNIFFLAIFGMVVVATTETAFAAIMKPLIDGSFVEKNPETIRIVPLALIGIFLVRVVAMFSANYGMSWVGRKVIFNLRSKMFSRVLCLPTSHYDKTTSGELISKFTYDAEQVAGAATKAVTILVRDTLTVIGLLGWMIYLNYTMASVFIIVAPFVSLLIAYVTKRFRNLSRRIQSSMGKVTHVLEESIQAHRVVKIYGGQEYENRRFDEINQNNLRQWLKLHATTELSSPVLQLFVAFAFAGIIAMATSDEMGINITAGTFMSFMSAMLLLFAPVKRLTGVNADLQRGIAAAHSVFSMIDAIVEEDSGTRNIERVSGSIKYSNVSFQYSQNRDDVLHDVSFSIERGHSVAFVGKSGSGKSTLINLLPRLYDVKNGSILIDDVDIHDYTLTSLRNQISYVGQDIVLFNDTITNNIAYGRLQEISKQELINAAKTAHAWEFIEKLPGGMDTIVGERGLMLSGGQRQRIAIARAILKDAPILILDEATSALDTESERHIQLALEELLSDRTTLVIAHRLSTIENTDRIIVMDDGRIVESGTHRELLEKSGVYAALHQMQFNNAA